MKKTTVFFGIFVFAQAAAEASTGAQTAADLEMLIEEALHSNPGIKAAERAWLAFHQRVPQVSSLEDPIFRYTRWGASVETRVGPQENVLTLAQRFPFFGKLRLKGDMAQQDAAAAKQSYLATQRDVVHKVKTAYYDLYWIDQSLLTLDEYKLLLEDFRAVAERKYSTGIGIQVNVLKAEVEISSIEKRRLHFRELRQGVAARLNALLDRDAGSPIDPVLVIDTTRIPHSEPDLVRRAIDRRQELKSAEAMIDKFACATRLARREYWPDFTLSGSYITIPGARTGAVDNGKDAWAVSVGINVPIWLGKRRARVDEALSLWASSRGQYENSRNEVEAEIRDLYARVQTSGHTLELYARRLIPDAERTLRSASASYQTGALDFLTLLDSERMLLDFRLAHARERANYRQQVAALERAAGGEL